MTTRAGQLQLRPGNVWRQSRPLLASSRPAKAWPKLALGCLGLVLIVASGCSDDSAQDDSSAAANPSTTLSDDELSGCDGEKNCEPEACAVTTQTSKWGLYSIDSGQSSWRVATTVTAKADERCLEANPAGRIEVRGTLDGVETDLFGDGEGATGFKRLGVLERQITLVLRCDDDIPEAGLTTRSWIDDLLAQVGHHPVVFDTKDCSANRPEVALANCAISTKADIVQDPGDIPKVRVTVELVDNDNESGCPHPSGFADPLYFARITLINQYNEEWDYQDSRFGLSGLPIDPDHDYADPVLGNHADFGYRGCAAGTKFGVTVVVEATFQGQLFDDATIELGNVPCSTDEQADRANQVE